MLQLTSLQGAQLGRTILQQDQALGADCTADPAEKSEIPWRFTPLCRELEHRGLERTINKIASLT